MPMHPAQHMERGHERQHSRCDHAKELVDRYMASQSDGEQHSHRSDRDLLGRQVVRQPRKHPHDGAFPTYLRGAKAQHDNRT